MEEEESVHGQKHFEPATQAAANPALAELATELKYLEKQKVKQVELERQREIENPTSESDSSAFHASGMGQALSLCTLTGPRAAKTDAYRWRGIVLHISLSQFGNPKPENERPSTASHWSLNKSLIYPVPWGQHLVPPV